MEFETIPSFDNYVFPEILFMNRDMAMLEFIYKAYAVHRFMYLVAQWLGGSICTY